jgi:hypothetical protein
MDMHRTNAKSGMLALILTATLAAGCGGEPGAKTDRITNSELAEKVRARLAGDPEIAPAHIGIDTDISTMTVTLSGTLKSEDLRKKAVALAESAHPGIKVTDTITVPPVQTTVAKPTAAKKPAAKPASRKRKPSRKRT